jgi:hypothetical protein
MKPMSENRNSLFVRFLPRIRPAFSFKWYRLKTIIKGITEEELPSSVEPEPTRTFIKSLFSSFDKVTKWKRFRRTRRYVIKGEKLFDLTGEKLSKLKVMGPWTFNIYETVLVAIPSQILAKVVNFFSPYEDTLLPIPESSSLYEKATIQEINKLAPSVESFFTPLIAPTILLAISSIIGWACLRKEDSTKQSRRRCRNAYLYYDGTYGLLPQTMLSFALTILIISGQRNVENNFFYLISILFLLVAIIYQLNLIYSKIPQLLFQLNDYETSVPMLNSSEPILNSSKPQAPWTKYGLSVFFLTGPIAWIIYIVFVLLMILVISILVLIKIWIRGPV